MTTAVNIHPACPTCGGEALHTATRSRVRFYSCPCGTRFKTTMEVKFDIHWHIDVTNVVCAKTSAQPTGKHPPNAE